MAQARLSTGLSFSINNILNLPEAPQKATVQRTKNMDAEITPPLIAHRSTSSLGSDLEPHDESWPVRYVFKAMPQGFRSGRK